MLTPHERALLSTANAVFPQIIKSGLSTININSFPEGSIYRQCVEDLISHAQKINNLEIADLIQDAISIFIPDPHGDLIGLAQVFFMCGMLNEQGTARKNLVSYILGGDYISRGDQSLETLQACIHYKHRFDRQPDRARPDGRRSFFKILEGNHEIISLFAPDAPIKKENNEQEDPITTQLIHKLLTFYLFNHEMEIIQGQEKDVIQMSHAGTRKQFRQDYAARMAQINEDFIDLFNQFSLSDPTNVKLRESIYYHHPIFKTGIYRSGTYPEQEAGPIWADGMANWLKKVITDHVRKLTGLPKTQPKDKPVQIIGHTPLKILFSGKILRLIQPFQLKLQQGIPLNYKFQIPAQTQALMKTLIKKLDTLFPQTMTLSDDELDQFIPFLHEWIDQDQIGSLLESDPNLKGKIVTLNTPEDYHTLVDTVLLEILSLPEFGAVTRHSKVWADSGLVYGHQGFIVVTPKGLYNIYNTQPSYQVTQAGKSYNALDYTTWRATQFFSFVEVQSEPNTDVKKDT